ncbi:Type IV fimbrial biogenesis protein FimT [Lysobacter dokdonensis DS-58]|uniref:Type II secretion system protein H n=1 Tax=Lysobacter dokdonensis DS-58 TaxID=1300345 RepID=A0A0A2WJ53_9GAMM|nr:GspH/FimT family pseudopilin [Lysobacter dokdonensis]KGQ18737.1 Type IV fimbrial biogenesis protein FimT [Lysobacter dokdonensis DS-58]
MRAQRSPGFTLLELMIAVAILAVLAALAAPSLSDFFDRHRVRAAADDVSSLISHARAESVKHDLPITIAMNGSGTAWCVGANEATPPTGGAPAGESAACDCTQDTQCMVAGIRQVVSSGEYRGVAIGALPSDFRFDNTLGAIVTTGGLLGSRQVTLTSPSGKYDVVVEVETLGQARSCTPSSRPAMSGMPQC